eukprot:2629129-Alexandrium_andersonii.AAC.1
MSASLVGSEMCIRDRKKEAIAAARTAKGGGGGPQGRARACPERPAQPRHCLLYTSDAADDM